MKMPYNSLLLMQVLLAFPILMVGCDWAAMDGRMARELALPGSAIIPFIPWIAVGMYISVVALTRKRPNRWTRIGSTAAGLCLAGLLVSYPNGIFRHFSHKIDIREFVLTSGEFLPISTVADFRLRFNTPTVQYSASHDLGPWLVVPAQKYSETMLLFLRDQKTKAEPTAAASPSVGR